MRRPSVGGSSPWGVIQTLTLLGPDLISVSTAGHGGIWISPERERLIPVQLRAVARQYAPSGWYEEDCDWAIPVGQFAGELTAGTPEDRARMIDAARQTLAGARYQIGGGTL